MNAYIRTLICVLLFAFCTHSKAVLLEYNLTNIANNIYQYEYTVTNTSIIEGLWEFTVYFDQLLYTALGIPAAHPIPDGWDGVLIQPDPTLPDDGFFDALALGVPLGLNESIGGFVVQFEWLGIGSPTGAQSFDILDAGFNLIGSGFTPLSASIPEPEIFSFMLIGLMIMWMKYVQRSHHKENTYSQKLSLK